MNTNNEIIKISSEWDVVLAKKLGDEKAKEIGFNNTDQARIQIVISELARNIFLYAKRGEIHIESTTDGIKVGILIKAIDSGPGIENIKSAMEDGFSTSGGLGYGLSGVNRLMDKLIINSEFGSGTEIIAIKWINNDKVFFNRVLN